MRPQCRDCTICRSTDLGEHEHGVAGPAVGLTHSTRDALSCPFVRHVDMPAGMESGEGERACVCVFLYVWVCQGCLAVCLVPLVR